MIVITGANGQLGQEFGRMFGSDAVGLKRSQLDVTDPHQTEIVLRDLRPSVIINCAGYTAVDKAEDDCDACFAINAKGVKHLADVASKLGALLVQISTDYVFGQADDSEGPLAETALPSPQGVYATSKYEGEQHAAGCPRHLILRTCGLYGSADRSIHFVDTMLRLGGQHDELRIVNDQRCNPTSAVVFAEAARELITLGAAGTFHIVSSPAMSWFEFATEVFSQAKMNVRVVPITSQEYGSRAPRPRYSVLDTAKYTRITGKPLASIHDSLNRYLIEHHQSRSIDSKQR